MHHGYKNIHNRAQQLKLYIKLQATTKNAKYLQCYGGQKF